MSHISFIPLACWIINVDTGSAARDWNNVWQHSLSCSEVGNRCRAQGALILALEVVF